MSTPIRARLVYTDGTMSALTDTVAKIVAAGVSYSATISPKTATVKALRIRWGKLVVDLAPPIRKTTKGTPLTMAGLIDVTSLKPG